MLMIAIRKIIRYSLATIIFIACFPSCTRKMDVIALREDHAVNDMELLEYTQAPIFQEALTLEEIIDIALAFNLDVYAQQYEREAQARISNAVHLQMLPALTADAFWDARNHDTSAFSKILYPRILTPTPLQPQYPSISTIRTTMQDDIRLTVNFIDMALAYFRAKEEKNRTRILEQQHIRARQKLILDITDAYWKAVAAKKTLDEMVDVINMSTQYQQTLQQQIEQRTISELQGLQIASRLADQQSQFEALRYAYENSKGQLSALMGLIPGTYFELADEKEVVEEINEYDIKVLEEEALRMRPELYIKDLEERVSIERVRESIVPMLPNASMFIDENYDGNPFLVHNYWFSVGMRATWNLLLIPQKVQEMRAGEAQREFAVASRLALSIGVISQVHLAYLNYRDALNQYKIARHAADLRDRLSAIAEAIERTGEFHGLDVLNFRSDALLGRINAMRTYANLRVAEEQLNYAVGRPSYYPKKIEKIEVQDSECQ